MAENKISFLLYCDYLGVFEQLSNREAGLLIKHILRYVNDKDPKIDNRIVGMAFEPIKLQLKRDLKEWEIIRQDRSVSGKLGNLKRWHNDLYDKVIKKEISIADAEIIANGRTPIVPDRTRSQSIANIAVTDTVTVTENVGEKDRPLPEFRIEECLTVAMNDERWVKANKVTTKDLQEFNKLLERRGRYKKNPADYKEHFHNWKAGGKKESFFDSKEPEQNLNGHLVKLTPKND